MTQCTYCGQLGHRASKCPRRPFLTAAVLGLLLAGCSATPTFTFAPDSLCQAARPAWATNDTHGTKEAQKAAAAVWDRKCTLLGAWR